MAFHIERNQWVALVVVPTPAIQNLVSYSRRVTFKPLARAIGLGRLLDIDPEQALCELTTSSCPPSRHPGD